MIGARRIGMTLRKLALLTIVLAIVGLAMAGAPPASAAQAVTLKIADPSGSAVIQGNPGERVTMQVIIQGENVRNMAGIQFKVRFNNQIVKVPDNGVSKGEIPSSFLFLSNVDNAEGFVAVAVAGSSALNDNDVTIASITFELLGAGQQTTLSFADVVTSDASGDNTAILASPAGGSIAVAPSGEASPTPGTATPAPAPTSTPVPGSSPPVASGATPTPQPTSVPAQAATSTPPSVPTPVPTATQVGTPAPTSTPGPSAAALATSTPLPPTIAATATASAASPASGPTVVPTSIPAPPAPSPGASPAGASTPTPMASALSTPTAERLVANVLTPEAGASPTAAPASESESDGGLGMGLIIAIVVGVVVVIGAAITLGQLFLRRQG